MISFCVYIIVKFRNSVDSFIVHEGILVRRPEIELIRSFHSELGKYGESCMNCTVG